MLVGILILMKTDMGQKCRRNIEDDFFQDTAHWTGSNSQFFFPKIGDIIVFSPTAFDFGVPCLQNHEKQFVDDPSLQLECFTKVNQQNLLLSSAYDLENVHEERENKQNHFEKEEEETEKSFQIQVLRDQLCLAAQLGQQVLDENAELEAKLKEVTQESETAWKRVDELSAQLKKSHRETLEAHQNTVPSLQKAAQLGQQVLDENAELEAKLKEVTQESETAWKRVDELSAQLKKSRQETLEAHQNPVPPLQKEWDGEACLRQEETLLQEISELRVLLEAEQRKIAKLNNELVEARLEVNAYRDELQKCENECFQEKKRATEEIEKYRGECLEHEILIKSLKKALQSTKTQPRTLSNLSTKPPFWESPLEKPAGNGIPLHPDAYYNPADSDDSKNSPTIQKKTYPRRNKMLRPQTPKSKVVESNACSDFGTRLIGMPEWDLSDQNDQLQ